MSAKRYIVTGAGGFVGSNLVSRLVQDGHQVIGLVRSPAQEAKVKALGGLPVLGDVLDSASLDRAMAGCDGVFHLAALFRQASHPRSRYFEVNVDGTRNVVESALRSNVKKFIHCSTVGVHGHIENPPGNEETPLNPGDDYQDSKVAGEKLITEYFQSGRIEGCIIRPAMIWGPGDDRTFKLFNLIARRRFFFVGDGEIHLHFVDVRDVALGLAKAMITSTAPGKPLILAGANSISINQLISVISALLGAPEPKLRLPIRPLQALGDLVEALCVPFNINPPIYRRRVDFFTKQRSFSTTLAKQELGFEPRQDLVHEIIDIIRSYIQLGWLSIPATKLPSVILRTMDGLINEWDMVAEDLYGWSRLHAVGSVSHSLLRTGFPEDLTEINAQLVSLKRWSGQLRHKTREGLEVKVISRWNLIPQKNSTETMVLETNLPASWNTNFPFDNCFQLVPTGVMWQRISPFLEEFHPCLSQKIPAYAKVSQNFSR